MRPSQSEAALGVDRLRQLRGAGAGPGGEFEINRLGDLGRRTAAVSAVLAGVLTLASPALAGPAAAQQGVVFADVGAPFQNVPVTDALDFDVQRGMAIRSSTGRKGRLLLGVSGCCGTANTKVTITLEEGSGEADELYTFPFDRGLVAKRSTAGPSVGHTYLTVRAKSAFGSVRMSYKPTTGNLAPKLVNGYPACYQQYVGDFTGQVSFNPHSKAWGRIRLPKRLTIGHSDLELLLPCGFNGYPPTFCERSGRAIVFKGLLGPSLTAITPWIGRTAGDTSESSGPAQLIYSDTIKTRGETVQRKVQLRRLPANDIAFDYASGHAYLIRIAPKLAYARGGVRIVVTSEGTPTSFACEYHGLQGTNTLSLYGVTSIAPISSPLTFAFSVGPSAAVDGASWQPSPTNYQDGVDDTSYSLNP